MGIASVSFHLFAPDLAEHSVRGLLELLLGSCRCADAVGQSALDFAPKLAAVLRTGVTEDRLRLLIEGGLLAHHVETSRKGAARRSFRACAGPGFSSKSAFLLTTAGEACAARL